LVTIEVTNDCGNGQADDKKSGFEAWKAALIAGRLGLPTPMWAIDILEKAEHVALNALEEKGGRR